MDVMKTGKPGADEDAARLERERKPRRHDGLWKDRKSGCWCYRFKGLDGKHRRVQAPKGASREEASALRQARIAEILKAQIAGLSSVEQLKPTSFSAFVEGTYLPAMAPPTRRPNTHDRDKSYYKTVKPMFGNLSLKAIGVAEIERYMAWRKTSVTYKNKPPSPAQMNRERVFLGAVLSMAMRHELIDRNPVPCVKKLREDNQRDRVLSPAEEAAILEKADEFVRPIIVFAIQTGMRLGEIVNLKWPDVDRLDGEAVLDGFIRVGEESKGHRVRYVPINADVKAILNSQRPVSKPGRGISPYVFSNPRFAWGYRPSSVYNAFKAAARRAKVEDVCFHTLRHCACSRMVAAGVPDRLIMQILGHRSPHMVTRYAHLAPGNLKGATACLASGFRVRQRSDSVAEVAPSGAAV